MKNKILIIEDDPSVKKLLEITLREYDFDFVSCENKKSAMGLYLSHNPDLIILDLGLPDGDGKGFIQEIRQISKIPIVIVSARHDEKEIVASLDSGADDYITKPFSINELLARMRANLRRGIGGQAVSETIVCGELELHLADREIVFKKESLKLTPFEYELLKYFLLNTNKTLTHGQILKEVWGVGYQNQMQYLRTYVNTLRKKIETTTTKPHYIKTESGIGYRFCCDCMEER